MRPLIFLDIDGVLTRTHNFKRNRHICVRTEDDHARKSLDHVLGARLQDAILRHNGQVVLSSTWRIHSSLEDIRRWFHAYGPRVPLVGKTPVLWRPHTPETQHWPGWRRIGRGMEVQWWLRTFVPNVAEVPIALIDDDGDFGDLRPWLVKTNTFLGFRAHQVRPLRRLLTQPMGPHEWKLDAFQCTVSTPGECIAGFSSLVGSSSSVDE